MFMRCYRAYIYLEVQSMEKIRAAQSFVELEIRKTLDEIEELKSQIEEEKVKSFTTFSTWERLDHAVACSRLKVLCKACLLKAASKR